MEPKTVGERVINLMKKHNMNIEELALKMELDVDNLKDKLDGNEEFFINEIAKIRDVFCLDIKELDELFFK